MKTLFERAKTVLNDLYADRSVPQTKTLAHLQELQDSLEMMIDALKYDIRKEKQ